MMRFGEICLNPENPDFSEECSNKTMILHSVFYGRIQECMQNMIDKEGKIEEDYITFQKKKLYTVPDLFINGVPYRGTWYSKYIFRSICNGFLDDANICEGINPREVIYNQRVGNGVLIFIIVITILVTSCSLLCYKRYINKNLEDALSERIEEQTMKSISQYQMFQDNKKHGSQLELVSE